MGRYINTGNDSFRKARNGEYVDKSALIGFVNRVLNTEHNMLCLTRARRFGKSMAAKMLNAYYDQSVDSRTLFQDLCIAKDDSFNKHLNKYPVIYLDVTTFTTKCSARMTEVLSVMDNALKDDCRAMYPDVEFREADGLPEMLLTIVENTHQPFIMIIDEWDAICRETNNDELVRQYVDWLRSLFKSGFTDRIFAGAYMTGILPILQYNTQSALNNFEEFSMVNPGPLAGYFGFTEKEVIRLSEKYNMDMDSIKQWYDGYQLGNEPAIYNPYAVMRAITRHSIEGYWSATSAYEGLKQYITMNFDGLYEDIVSLLADDSVKVDVQDFSNDIHEVTNRNSVLTLLIHLGYLSYNRESKSVRIPNYEVRGEFQRTIRETNWNYLAEIIQNSEKLLQDTLIGNTEAVEIAVNHVHQNNTSILKYNDENSLACVLSLAYIAAHKDYLFVRELPTGKGFADIVLMPRKNVSLPAIVLELKYDISSETAIEQIKQKQYSESLKDYFGEVILVGINYEKKAKEYNCIIERVTRSVNNAIL